MPTQRGVQYTDHEVGTGPQADRRSRVLVRLSIRLRRGEAVFGPAEQAIDLARREAVAGLRYGIAGMRVGGRRGLIVPPHLAYGPQGAAGRIPPNAVLECDVTLMAVEGNGADAAQSARGRSGPVP